ncbi:PadR family transcriptional regulator [Nocardia sp. NPDC004123]
MKLELLLLGVLGMVPATGYDLKKFFDTHGRFMRSNTQMSQVYRALSRLADEGLVTYEVQERPGPQDAKTYHLTAEGMTVFLDWLTGPYNPPTKFTDPEFLARMSFSGFMTKEQLLRLVETELAARRDQVARFRDRDRTLPQVSEFPFDRDLGIAMTEQLHRWGAEDIDIHIARLEAFRDDLRAGRFPAGS